MAIGERIRFIRNLRGMTQKYLGIKLGFSEKTSDVRMAQYENSARTPKENMIADLANILEVCPEALKVPDIDSYVGVAHTLFALEDLYGLRINNLDGELCLTLDRQSKSYLSMFDIFSAWQQESEKFKNGLITKEEYDSWRYNYPKQDTTQRWAKVPSKELSDMLTESFDEQ